jgi:hypothetical protein
MTFRNLSFLAGFCFLFNGYYAIAQDNLENAKEEYRSAVDNFNKMMINGNLSEQNIAKLNKESKKRELDRIEKESVEKLKKEQDPLYTPEEKKTVPNSSVEASAQESDSHSANSTDRQEEEKPKGKVIAEPIENVPTANVATPPVEAQSQTEEEIEIKDDSSKNCKQAEFLPAFPPKITLSSQKSIEEIMSCKIELPLKSKINPNIGFESATTIANPELKNLLSCIQEKTGSCVAYIKCNNNGTSYIRPSTCRTSYCKGSLNPKNAQGCVDDLTRKFMVGKNKIISPTHKIKIIKPSVNAQ